MRIIFLDVDGVLNYAGCPYKIGSIYFVDDEKLRLVKQIIDATGAKVVLSSTWRFGWMYMEADMHNSHVTDFIALREKCTEYGIEFISRTPLTGALIRGEEIDAWLKNWKGEPVESFVILDDDNDMQPYGDCLVQTSFDTGLTQEDVNKAIKILNGENYD